ncbi:unnamed protein product [Prorocentrum cordatum]|nr:unnamed protein product [Polarella glacialis]
MDEDEIEKEVEEVTEVDAKDVQEDVVVEEEMGVPEDVVEEMEAELSDSRADEVAKSRTDASTVKLTDSSTVMPSDSCADEFANSRADTSAVKLADPCAGTESCADEFANSRADTSTVKLADSCAVKLTNSCVDRREVEEEGKIEVGGGARGRGLRGGGGLRRGRRGVRRGRRGGDARGQGEVRRQGGRGGGDERDREGGGGGHGGDRGGSLHLSAPHIYAKSLESMMPMRRGMSFLNVGSGTGYFNSVVSELTGSAATNHGVDIHPETVAHANGCCQRLGKQHIAFTVGNVYQLNVRETMRYDRIYVGARTPLAARLAARASG